jgi:plasmid stabilization system protein ParE
MSRIIRTPQAGLDLIEFGLYIADDNLEAALKLLDAMEATFQLLVGNFDVQGSMPHEKCYHSFEPPPDYLEVIAFRLHGFMPGWSIPKLRPNSCSKDYGFNTEKLIGTRVSDFSRPLSSQPGRHQLRLKKYIEAFELSYLPGSGENSG